MSSWDARSCAPDICGEYYDQVSVKFESPYYRMPVDIGKSGLPLEVSIRSFLRKAKPAIDLSDDARTRWSRLSPESYQDIVKTAFRRESLVVPKLELGEIEKDCPYCAPSRTALEPFAKAVARIDVLRPFASSLLSLRYRQVYFAESFGIDSDSLRAEIEKARAEAKVPEVEEMYRYMLVALDYAHAKRSLEALKAFEPLLGARNPWVVEAAGYTLFVAKIQQIETAFEKDEKLDEKTTQLVAEAERFLEGELKSRPSGYYADEIVRYRKRVAIYRKDDDRIAQALAEGFERDLLNGDIGGLLWDQDETSYFPGAKFSRALGSPFTAAAVPLPDKPGSALLTELEAKKAAYDKFPGYLTFVRARILFAQKKFEELVKEKFSINRAAAPVEIARAVLVAEAYEELKRFGAARTIRFSVQKIVGAQHRLQARLARNYFLDGKIHALVLPGSGVSSEEIINEILHFDASESDLEAVARDPKARIFARKTAARALFHAKLRVENYPGAQRLLGTLDPKVVAQFQNIRTSLETLAASPTNPAALLRLAAFLNSRGTEIGGSVCFSDSIGTPLAYRGERQKSLSPFVLYAKSLEGLDSAKDAEPELVAEVLYRMISCYRSTGEGYMCHPDEKVPESDRKAWFERLKRKHASSPWSRKLKYYY